jgi:peroxidase
MTDDLHVLFFCSLINQQRIKEKDILLRQHFFKTQEVYPPGNVDKFLIALATVPSRSVDNYFTEEVITCS